MRINSHLAWLAVCLILLSTFLGYFSLDTWQSYLDARRRADNLQVILDNMPDSIHFDTLFVWKTRTVTVHLKDTITVVRSDTVWLPGTMPVITNIYSDTVEDEDVKQWFDATVRGTMDAIGLSYRIKRPKVETIIRTEYKTKEVDRCHLFASLGFVPKTYSLPLTVQYTSRGRWGGYITMDAVNKHNGAGVTYKIR